MSFPLENNPRIAAVLENIFSSGRMPHAFLIEGEDEAVTLSLAKYIAQAAVCSAEKRPCGVCRECRTAAGGNHPDISFTAPEAGKKAISVAAVRKVRTDAYIKPHSANSRVFIIEGAQRMNPQAQNALLKVLEEPPAGVVFLLTCPSRTQLLDTVLSRCTLLSVNSEKASRGQSKASAAAAELTERLFTASELELLQILYPFERDRVAADELFACLERSVAERMRAELKNPSRLKRLSGFFEDIKEYRRALELNVNLSLLFSAMVCRLKNT